MIDFFESWMFKLPFIHPLDCLILSAAVATLLIFMNSG